MYSFGQMRVDEFTSQYWDMVLFRFVTLASKEYKAIFALKCRLIN